MGRSYLPVRPSHVDLLSSLSDSASQFYALRLPVLAVQPQMGLLRPLPVPRPSARVRADQLPPLQAPPWFPPPDRAAWPILARQLGLKKVQAPRQSQ